NLTKATQEFSLKRTKKEHLNGKLNNSLISVKQDKSTSMRTDGNNVDMDLEKVNQASNTLMYNALITQANSKLNMTKSVISGGSR
ncbi:MAG: flagellar basal body rod protein FlgB, partial [Clostridium sp.]|nr:flagellar basal body rod protein FlgB [Clostridium sp.]